MSNLTINTKENEKGIFEPTGVAKDITSLVDDINNYLPVLSHAINQAEYGTNMLNIASNNLEIANRRHNVAQYNRSIIINNINQEYNQLAIQQDNLLYTTINYHNIKLWRYKDNLYFRANNGELIIEKQIEMQKELSSRYSNNIYIVNDINDIIVKSNTKRANTIYIAINRIPIVEYEVSILKDTHEVFWDNNNHCFVRNLLSHTRLMQDYKEERLFFGSSNYIDNFMSKITEVNLETINYWLKNIDSKLDNILLLVGNKSASEDFVIDKVIEPLFDTGIVCTITDNMLEKQSLQEITDNKLFLHINHIPDDKEKQQNLQELITASLINHSIKTDNGRLPIQCKIIVTLDEPHIFFKDYIEMCTVVFIDTIENIHKKMNVNSNITLYRDIENSLDSYSYQILNMDNNQSNSIQEQNKRYIELLRDTSNNVKKSDGLPILDPYSDNFENLIPKGDYHTLITGLTRIGKSLLMLSLIMRYIFRKDCSIVLFDIHGDLAKKVVRLIKDKERLVYISPLLDTSYSPTINLFDIFDKSEKNIARVSQIILRVLKSIKTDESFSSPMEELLLHCIRVLLRKGGGSFIELYRFMNDKRNDDLIKYAKQSPNPLEEEYFTDYFASATATKDAVRRRLSTLLSDPLFSNLMNGTNTIDLEKEMNTPGKIIIIDIPKGEMETTYEYYIKFMLEYIQVLALKRVKTPKIEDRTLTHVFLDEAHNFITPNGNIETILTEAGKYNLYLTMANQAVSQYKTAKFQDIILSMTDAKIIGKNSNDTLTAMNKTLNTKLKDVENLAKGVFYASVANNDVVKFKNTDIFLNTDKEISDGQWQEHKQYQLSQYQRNINPEIKSKPTEDELKQMIHQFKSDIISKNLTEASCLYKLKTTAPERFTEIESDFEYRTIRDKEYRPRMRRPEISTIFKLAFELEDLIDNTDFTQMLKGDNAMFDKTDSGTRSKNFGGSSGSEQYYYFKQ